MGYRVKDSIEVSLLINDLEYPLSAGNTLNFLHMSAGTKLLLPSCHFSVVDITGSMPHMKLADASPIQIIVNHSGVVTSRRFRLHTWDHPPGSELYNIDGFWDAPRYRVGTADKSIQATSTDALKKIAAECGLGYNGVSTNDPQLWIPRNRTFGEFAAYITKHGYIGSQSHLVSVVDSLGYLRYKDARAPERTFLGTFGYESDKAYRIQEFQPSTKAGLTSALGSYRDTRIGFSVYHEPKVHDTLSFQPDSRNLLLSQDARDQQARGSYSYSPIDFGNTHENFQRAHYQNKRFDTLLNLSGEFMIFNPTLMEPLDCLNFTTEAQAENQYEGNYVLAHKVIYVQGNTYVEKFVGLREGLS